MKIKKLRRLRRELFAVMAAVFAMTGLPVSAAAAESGEQVLSGEIGDVEIGSDVQKIVLDGVTQGTENELTVNGDVVVEIADGTDNTLGDVSFLGNTQITGGGNLTADVILSVANMLVFDHTGTISVPNGAICSLTGDIYFNSGTVDVTTTDDIQLAIYANSGSIYVNGGNITSNGIMCAFYAGTAIDLAGGTVEATATKGAAFTAGKGEEGCLTVSDSFALENGVTAGEGTSSESGSTVSTLLQEDGQNASDAAGSGPAAEDKIAQCEEQLSSIMYTSVDSEDEEASEEETASDETTEEDTDTSEEEYSEEEISEVESSGESAEDSEESVETSEENDEDTAEDTATTKKSIPMIPIIVVCAVGGAAVAAFIPLWLNNKKQGKKRRKK